MTDQLPTSGTPSDDGDGLFRALPSPTYSQRSRAVEVAVAVLEARPTSSVLLVNDGDDHLGVEAEVDGFLVSLQVHRAPYVDRLSWSVMVLADVTDPVSLLSGSIPIPDPYRAVSEVLSHVPTRSPATSQDT